MIPLLEVRCEQVKMADNLGFNCLVVSAGKMKPCSTNPPPNCNLTADKEQASIAAITKPQLGQAVHRGRWCSLRRGIRRG